MMTSTNASTSVWMTLLDRGFHEDGRVVDDVVLDIVRELAGELLQRRPDAVGRSDGVGAGRLDRWRSPPRACH